MKTKLLLSSLLSFSFCLLSSQVPLGFNYQAIARDGSGAIIPNTALPVKITIQTSTGTVIYEELFSSITSNQFGLISLVVGTGTWQSGSATTFSAIDWKAQTLYLKTQIQYPGPGWTVMGTSQIWATPYSLVAKDVAGPLTKLGITGTTDNMDEALFEVKNKAGNTVFAVYNEGVRAYVGNGDAKGVRGGFAVGGYDATKGSTHDLFVLNTDSARFYIDSKPNLKGKKGGFSVGGYDMTKGAAVHDYLDVSKDSVRIYVDSNPLTKGKKGGFSVGGYDMTKGGIPTQDYMHVSKDSVRVYVDSNPLTKGKRGGFAVGGYDLTKGGVTVQKFLAVNPDSTRIVTSDTLKGFGVSNLKSGNSLGYLRLTPSNYFIGHQAGKSITTGLYNSVIGYKAGYGLKTGISNSYIGYKAGYSGTFGNCNVFLGNEAGYSNNGSNNTFIGFISGHNNTAGVTNSFFGDSTGYSNTWGWNNTFLGGRSGFANTSGHYNTFAGAMSGYSNSTGFSNTLVGYSAGQNSTTGWDNIMIGYNAGQNNTTGADNMYIGFEAGKNSSTNYYNTSIGYQAGYNTSAGNSNLMVGFMAGYSNTGTYNVLLGDQAGYHNQADGNVFIGPQGPGYANTSGKENTMIGDVAGKTNTTGNLNLFMGSASGYSSNGNYNIYLGANSGTYSTGNNNVFMGYATGWTNINGSGNVFLGFQAGYNEIGSNKLYIANSSTNPPLIYGDFSSGNVGIGTSTPTAKLEVNMANASAWSGNLNALRIYSPDNSFYMNIKTYVVSGGNVGYHFSPNGNNGLTITTPGWVGIGTITPGQKLDIIAGNGRVQTGYSWLTNSDIRYKKNIYTLEGCLEKVMAMRGVSFDLKNDSLDVGIGRKNIGFIAQELENVVPEVVVTGSDGYKAVAYDKLTAVLTEAIKEQQKQIESYKSEIVILQEKVGQIGTQQKEIDELKTLVNKLIASQTAQVNK